MIDLGKSDTENGMKTIARLTSGLALAILLLFGAETDDPALEILKELREELKKLGWTEGGNLQLDVRFGGGDFDRTRADAAEFVNLAPDAILHQAASSFSTSKFEPSQGGVSHIATRAQVLRIARYWIAST